jgi:hypothetical protein
MGAEEVVVAVEGEVDDLAELLCGSWGLAEEPDDLGVPGRLLTVADSHRRSFMSKLAEEIVAAVWDFYDPDDGGYLNTDAARVAVDAVLGKWNVEFGQPDECPICGKPNVRSISMDVKTGASCTHYAQDA